MNLEAVLTNIPLPAIILFLLLGIILGVEIWYLRPKRKLPPIPSREVSSPAEEEFRPLSQKQIVLISLLLLLLLIIPLSAFLLKQAREARKVVLSPSPTIPISPPPPETPTPTPTPTPFFSPSPTATVTARLKKTPLPTKKPTPTPTPKVGAVIPSPTPLPKLEKPKELPPASFPHQFLLLALLGLSALSLGGILLWTKSSS